MNPKTFASEILEQVIKRGMITYEDLFQNTQYASVTDDYWKEALKFFDHLETNEKEVFFKILRQISVDTAATILAILDGHAVLENQDKDFVLTLEGDENQINGELQELFLEMEENDT